MSRYILAFLLSCFVYSSFALAYFLYMPKLEKKQELSRKKRVVSLEFVKLKKVQTIKKVEKKEIQKQVKKQRLQKQIKKRIVKKYIKRKKVYKNRKTIEKKLVKKVSPKKIIEKKEIIKHAKIDKPLVKKLEHLHAKKIVKVDYSKDFLKENLQLIKQLIQKHIKYSKRAIRMNIQGQVLVEFVLAEGGAIKSVKTISGHKFLRKSTVKAIYEASKKFPKVKESIRIKIPIEYKLI